MIRVTANERDQHIAIERPASDNALDGAGSGDWAEVGKEWVGILDKLPSRAEKLIDGVNIAARPARVRMRYRGDVTPDMRFVLLRWDGSAWVPADRVMQIVAGPAVLGRRDGLEFMVEDYTSAGNPA